MVDDTPHRLDSLADIERVALSHRLCDVAASMDETSVSMMRRTHAAAGLAIGFALAGQTHQPLLNAGLLALLTQTAALLPDLDLKLHIKHRTVTHSLLALALISLGAWYSVPLLLPYISLGYGSHLVLDFLTVWGIPLFWPLQKRFRLLKISTGGRIDSLFAVGALCAALYCVVILLRL